MRRTDRGLGAAANGRRAWVAAGIGLAAAGVLLGWLAGSLLTPRRAAPDVTGATSALTSEAQPAPLASGDDIARLRAELRAERDARESLASELAALRQRVDSLALGGVPDEAAPADASRTATARVAEAPGAAPGGAAQEGQTAAGRPAPTFDTDALVTAGMDPRGAATLHDRWQRYQMDKLYLNDQAMREGWLMTPRHRDQHLSLDAAFRKEIGEEGYDAYLFATGADNRVVVRDVFSESVADRLGLQAGDEIRSYDGARIHTPQELSLATSGGKAGDLVPIEIVRDGRSLRLRIERGPIGVAIEGARRPPDAH